MRVVVAGASGLLGAALVQRLERAGHVVIRAGRGAELPLDYLALPSVQALAQHLRGVDAVVNAVGIFQPSADQSFDALHVKGPQRLFDAAVAAGVPRLLQISALGADAGSVVGYFRSKGIADRHVLALPASVAVVRPSLVFAPDGASTRQFARWALWPWTPLPARGAQRVQPIHIDDLVALLARLLEGDATTGVIDAVGPRALTLREYLGGFKRAFRRAPRFIPIPAALIRAVQPIASRLSGGLASADAMAMLEAGSTADATAATRIIGRPLRDPADFFDRATANLLRMPAQWAQWLTLMRLSLAILWLGTAWVSLFGWPRADSHAMLAELGLSGAFAEAALWSSALLDALFGAGLLLLRRRRWLYLAQMLLVCAYTVLISVGLPELWLHPFGPVLKNIPLLAMTYALYCLDRNDGSRLR